MDVISSLRQYKIGPFAYFDLITAFLGMYLLAQLIDPKLTINFLLLTLPFGILVHILIGTKTPLTQMFCEDTRIQAIMILLTVAGLLYSS